MMDTPQDQNSRVQAHRQQALDTVKHALDTGKFAWQEATNLFNAYVDECHRLIDKALNQREQALACHKGCSDCCTLFVNITYDEVLNIARVILQLPLRQQVILRSRNLLHCAKIEEAEATDAPQAYRALQLRCMFLGEDGACLIHPARPLACRHHHSFDVTYCQGGAEALQHLGRIRVGVGAFQAKAELLRPEYEKQPEFTRWEGELHTMLRPFLFGKNNRALQQSARARGSSNEFFQS
jgi:Fe-S-cluster containining protein